MVELVVQRGFIPNDDEMFLEEISMNDDGYNFKA